VVVVDRPATSVTVGPVTHGFPRTGIRRRGVVRP
jgi:hypothetical protein